MKIEVNIDKKHMFAFVFILVAFAGLFFAYAYDTSTPTTFGHTPSETGQGTTYSVFGGSSTFNGPFTSQWFFPGILSVGGPNPSFYTIHAVNRSSNGLASVGISGGSATGKEELGFVHDGIPTASIFWNVALKALEVNGFYKNNTIINGGGGKVGIGVNPLGSQTLQVGGSINATGFGSDISASRDIIASGTVYGKSALSGNVTKTNYLCVNAFDPGTGVDPVTNPGCVHGVPLQSNMAINQVIVTNGQVKLNSNKAVIFVSFSIEPLQNGDTGTVYLEYDAPSAGANWITYAMAGKYGDGGFGRVAELTAFIPPGYSYRIRSAETPGPFTGFETTFG